MPHQNLHNTCTVHLCLYLKQGAIIRASHGQAPFGTTSQQKLFYAVRAIPEFIFGMVMVLFPTFGCYWMYRQVEILKSQLHVIFTI